MLTSTAKFRALASPEIASSSTPPTSRVVVHYALFLTFFFFFVKTRNGQWVVVTADTSVKPIKSTKPIAANIRVFFWFLLLWLFRGMLTHGVKRRTCPSGAAGA
jgi:hypothetical protein